MNELLPYQKTGAEWLTTKKRALLADEMRLGKTIQAIAACDAIDAQRILVVCPAVARPNWVHEFKKWSKRTLDCWTLPQDHSFLPRGTCIGICSYDYLTRNGNSSINGEPLDILILDEAHYCKNPSAKRTSAAYSVPARRVWCLTGTPAPKNAIELWPMMHAFGIYRDGYDAFARQFCQMRDTSFGVQFTGHKNVSELRDLLSTFMLRRKIADVMPELPPIRFSTIVVDPGPVDLQAHFPGHCAGVTREVAEKRVLAEVRKQGSEIADVETLDAETLDTIRAQYSTYRRYTGLQKVPAVVELVKRELDEDPQMKIVVFAIHRSVIQELQMALHPEYGVGTVYGNTNPKRRQRNIVEFQGRHRPRVFIGQVAAAGTAIDLSVAHDVLFVEADWVPANNVQAAMRCQHIRQKNPVFVRFVTTPDSLDQAIHETLRRRTASLAEVFS